MERIKVLLVAPYEGLKNIALALRGNDERFMLEARVGDLDAGVRIVRMLRGESYDVIISRGGTTELIEGITETPVVDIELSQYDILHAIKLSQNYSGRTAIVGFPKIIEKVGAICALLGYDLNINVVNSAEQVPACLSRLKAEGYSLIIGDTITVETAKQMHMNGILITSGNESVLSAFAEAEKICRALSSVRREALFCKDILRSGESVVIAVGEDGRVVIPAPPADVEDSDLQVMENWCRAAADEVFKKGRGSSVRKLRGALWRIAGRRGDGEFAGLSYFYLRRGLEITNMEKAIQIESASLRRPAANSSFYDDSESTQNILEHIRRLSYADLPVVIFGEPGTGKDSAAYEICRRGEAGDRTLLTVDCRVLEERQLDYLLRNEKSPLLEGGICVYFKRIDALGEEALRTLARYASDSLLHRRNRVIYSCEESPSSIPREVSAEHLLNESGQGYLTLRLPSLRERIGDIPSIASIYINDLNIALGKQVAGLDARSTALLREFPWRTNITQLRNVLRELVLVTDGAFISENDTRRVLQKEEAFRGMPDSPDFFRGTLDEITLNVLRKVLEEEDMNQSNAAKRLGISRSTLWRKLQG